MAGGGGTGASGRRGSCGQCLQFRTRRFRVTSRVGRVGPGRACKGIPGREARRSLARLPPALTDLGPVPRASWAPISSVGQPLFGPLLCPALSQPGLQWRANPRRVSWWRGWVGAVCQKSQGTDVQLWKCRSVKSAFWKLIQALGC